MKNRPLSTNNYSLFTPHPKQRPIRDSHVQFLMGQMRKRGFLSSFPLMCVKVGQKIVVVDGHHRLEAAKNLGIILYYNVEGLDCLDAIGDVNASNSRWVLADFVRSHVVDGKPDYITLQKYVDCGVAVVMAASLLAGHSAGSNNVTSALVNGTFKVKTTRHIDIILSIRDTMHGYNDAVSTSNFMKALSLCLWLPEFDHTIFLRTLKRYPMMLQRLSNIHDFLKSIEAVYNYNARGRRELPIALLARQAAKARSAAPLKDANDQEAA